MATRDTQWLWLETEAWVYVGRGRRRDRAPKKTIRANWKTLSDPDKAAIDPLIRTFRTDCNAVPEARRSQVPKPGNVADVTAKNTYIALLRHLRLALHQATGSTAVLLTERQRHAPPGSRTATEVWLDAIAHEYAIEMEDVDAAIATWTAERTMQYIHGSPPPTPDNEFLQHDAFPSPPNGTWIGGFTLGAGGQAVPAVYLRQNRHSRIIDRVVIKDTAWPYQYPDGATDPNTAAKQHREGLWDPDVAWASQDHHLKQPAEIGALNRLNAVPHSQSIVTLRSWQRVYRNGLLRYYRTYSEFCSYGDLWQLSRKYAPHDIIAGRPRPADGDEEDWLPESFVWACFEHLTCAAIAMERGPGTPAGPWSQIIHIDMKPENVFLATNTSQKYKGYPMLKLGDFGLAIILSSNPARSASPGNILGLGTPQTQAPEQISDDGSTHDIASHTNVWGIGLILWALLHSCAWGHDLYFDDEDDLSQLHDPRTVVFSPDHTNRYSATLRDLILSCIELEPRNRPTLNELFSAIREATNSQSTTTPDRASGLRDAESNDPRFLGDLHSLKLGAEKWPMYAHLALHWSGNAPRPEPARGQPTNLTGPDATLIGPSGGRVDEP